MDNLEVVKWLTKNGVFKNERTGHIDRNKETLQRYGLNTLKVNFSIEFNRNNAPVGRALRSDDVKTYNPFSHIGGEYTDELERLCASVISDTPNKDAIIREWLLNVVRVMSGAHEGKVLVFSGRQCIGKTYWFRLLLPDDLSRYYGESAFSNSADFRLLKREKIIINDSHLCGRFSALKKSASNRTVFCGTTNHHVLSDAYKDVIEVLSVDYELYKSIDKNRLLNQLLKLTEEQEWI